MTELESRENYINEILGLNDKPREINKNRLPAVKLSW